MLVFKRIEKHIGSKYPNFIKNILEFCGFDNDSTLLLLNEKSIEQIESEVDKNKHLVKDTVYEKKDGKFNFLIGHKELILNIPNILKTLAEQKKSKKLAKKIINQKQLDVEVLADELIERLNKYLKSKNFTCEVDKSKHIKLITLTEGQAKCTVQCVFCEITVTCTFNEHWSICNYPTHLRKHPEAFLRAEQPQEQTTPEASEREFNKIQRGNSSVLATVANILG